MENKNSVNILLVALIVLLATALGILGGYLIFNNINNENKEPEVNNGEQTGNKLTYDSKYEVIEETVEDEKVSVLVINGKKVDLSGYASKIVCEPMQDVLVAFVDYFNSSAIYAFDENGKVIMSVYNRYNDNVYHIKLGGQNYRGDYKFTSNALYINSDNLGQDDEYAVCVGLNSSDIAVYTEKISYLGNGKFSLPTITNKVTVEEYIKQNKIVCP